MWSLYVDLSKSAVGHIYTMWQAHASNVEFMYTSAPDDTFHCIEFI